MQTNSKSRRCSETKQQSSKVTVLPAPLSHAAPIKQAASSQSSPLPPTCRIMGRDSRLRLILSTLSAASLLATVIICLSHMGGASSSTSNNVTIMNRSQQLSALLSPSQPMDMVDASSQAPPKVELPAHEEGSTSLASAMLRAYTRANSMRAFHLDLHSYRAGAKFAGDPKFVDSANPAHRARCASHLAHYKNLLELNVKVDPSAHKLPIDSLRLADTFGRPEAGVLMGNQFWLGSYDSCLELKLAFADETRSQSGTIQSQYCLGVTQFAGWNPSEGKTSIKVGLCLPDTCSNSMLNETPELFDSVESMMKQQFGKTQPFVSLNLRSIYCLPHETSQARQYSKSALGFLIVVGLFVGACVFATIIDHYNKKRSKAANQAKSQSGISEGEEKRGWEQILFESFSLTRNLDKVLRIRDDEPAEASQQNSTSEGESQEDEDDIYSRSNFLNCTTGLKCLGLIWIIGAHTFLVSPVSSSNILVADKLTKTLLADVYLTAHLMVDTFFTLSGMLAAFFLFKAGIDNVSPKQWIVLTIHRYWRLTPIYLLCYWFTKSLGHLSGSGPFWDYMTAEQSPRLNCNRESWWDAILHMSDFKSPKEHCVPFAWFIANGIKFWLVTPIFLILINKSVRQGYMTTISTILTSMVLVAHLAMRSDVDMKSVLEFKPESADNMLNNMGEVYTRPYSRIGTYLIGLLAGHFIYMIDTQQIRVKLSRRTKQIVWSLTITTVLIMTFVLKIANKIGLDDRTLPIVFGITSALIRPLWALCTCWLVFALAHGQAKWLTRFLTANFWRILIKMSFCAYLVQGEVLAQLYLTMTAANSFTYMDLISRPIVACVLTLFVSLIMVLFLEYPLIGIEELILPKRQKSTQIKEKPINDNNLEDYEAKKLKSS